MKEQMLAILMMTMLVALALLALFFTSGCRMSTFYPLIGATAGGGAGALGGPATGATGAMAGYSIGEIAKQADQGDGLGSAKEMKEAIATVQALSTGDVEKILQMQMEKEGGFADKIMTETMGWIKLAALGCALYVIVPMVYTRYLHKKEAGHREELHFSVKEEVAKVQNGGGQT